MTNRKSTKTAYLYNGHIYTTAETLRCVGGVSPRHAGRVRIPSAKRPVTQFCVAHYANGPCIMNKLTDAVIADMAAGLATRAHTMNYDGWCYSPPAQ